MQIVKAAIVHEIASTGHESCQTRVAFYIALDYPVAQYVSYWLSMIVLMSVCRGLLGGVMVLISLALAVGPVLCQNHVVSWVWDHKTIPVASA